MNISKKFLRKLNRGEWVNSSFGTELLELHSFTVTKSKNMIIPSFIDLKVIPVEIHFFYKDKPFSGADVNGLFATKTNNKSFKFSTKTSEKELFHSLVLKDIYILKLET